MKKLKDEKSKKVDVVAAILTQRNRILVAQRPLQSSHGGGWEFPGGKVHSGESFERALVRELREELDLSIDEKGLQFLGTVIGETIKLHVYLSESLTPYVPNEHRAIAWKEIISLPQTALCPTDRKAIEIFSDEILQFVSDKTPTC